MVMVGFIKPFGLLCFVNSDMLLTTCLKQILGALTSRVSHGGDLVHSTSYQTYDDGTYHWEMSDTLKSRCFVAKGFSPRTSGGRSTELCRNIQMPYRYKTCKPWLPWSVSGTCFVAMLLDVPGTVLGKTVRVRACGELLLAEGFLACAGRRAYRLEIP